MPAAVRAAIDACGAASGPATRSSSTIRSRAARTSTTSRSSRPCSPTTALARVGGESRASRRSRRDGAGLDAARRDGDLPGGPADPARALDAEESRRCSSRRRARPTNGAVTSTRSAARTGSACARLRELGRATRRRRLRRDRRLRRTPHAARRSRALPDGDVSTSTTCSTRPAVATARVPRASSSRSPSRATRSRSTSRVPTRSEPGSVNAVEAVTVSAVAFALRSVVDPDLAGERRRAATGARDRAARVDRRRAAAGGGRRRQRRGEPARRRRVPRCARAGRARARRRARRRER